MNSREIRSINNQFESNGRIVSGYAIRFNEESVNMGFVEIIRPEALTREQVEDSDIFAFYNHNPEHVLARNGKADTLKLDLREDGLYYEFEAPNTSIGDELLEHIKRNEMYGTSFAFSMNVDGEGETWTRKEDGTIYREITSIEMLYEISPVFSPAYPTTSVSSRSLEMVEKLKQNDNMTDETKELRNDENIENEDEKTQEETQEQKGGDCADCEDEENRSENENSDDENNEDQEEKASDENTDDEENKQETSDENTDENSDETEDENKNIETNSHRTMEKQFSLLKTIRCIANGQALDEATQALVNEARNTMRNSGLTFNGQIQLPVESRATVTVTAEHDDVVETNFTDLLAPLQDNLVLVNAGARYMTNLVGDVQIPRMSAESCGWVGEIASAADGAGSFDHVTLSPKRLSAYVDVSKMFIAQDSIGAENMIRSMLVEALGQKLEETILGTAAGSTTKPVGLGYNVTPEEVSDFKGLCDVEASLEDANFWNGGRYILSPKAKAALRAMPKSSKMTQLVIDAATIDGTPFDTTNHVADDCFYYGDWSQLVIGQWGAIDVTVDPYSKAADGQVRIVVNAFFDAKLARPNSVVYGKVVEPEGEGD